jgi:transposase
MARGHGREAQSQRYRLPKHLKHINLNAAGIDVGSASHFVAVPEDRDTPCVRQFSSFTSDLHEIAGWLRRCAVDTVVMESTGVYWIPLYEVLEAAGFDVKLVNARHVKNVPGRKTDVLDCQWLQQLHTYGLLTGSFRPAPDIAELRSYLRQRDNLIRYAASHVQHMQKSLALMNLQLHNVISDITGATGMTIIRAILNGEQDPKILAQYRDYRCKASSDTIEQSLRGHYREEHLFCLRQAVELYDTYQQKIVACDHALEAILKRIESHAAACPSPIPKSRRAAKPRDNQPGFDLRTHLYRLTGVDLTQIDGINSYGALKVISEIGLDMSRWKTVKHFTSWLGLCPGNKISGGKLLNSATRRVANRAATALRLAASSLYASQSALGAFFRRLRARLGAPKAITATAHKLARLIYDMLKNRWNYHDPGPGYYEERYRGRVLKNLKHKAASLGYSLVPTVKPSPDPAVS